MILAVNSDYFLKERQPVDFVEVKSGVFYAVRTKFLNTAEMSFELQIPPNKGRSPASLPQNRYPFLG
jgi:hypothetical protein